ncbi:MAG: hypothetical protein AAGL49_10180, partial [Pseudomonadota bacterium]
MNHSDRLRRRRLRLAALLTSAAVAAPAAITAASAQSDAGEGAQGVFTTEQIVVTARKRAES